MPTVPMIIKQAFDTAKIVDTKLEKSVELQKNVEFHGTGNNLNQVAKDANINKIIDKIIDEIVMNSLLKIQDDVKRI